METALVLAASLTDLLATLAYGAHLRRFSVRSGRLGLALLTMGGLLALTGLVARLVAGKEGALETGFLAVAAVGPLIWALSQLSREERRPAALFGAFVAPVATMLTYALHVFDRESHVAFPGEVELVRPIHIGFSLVGFVVFGVAAVCSAIEVVQEYRLKTKRVTLAGRTLTGSWSLAHLERVTRLSLIIAFPLYSIGVALGAVSFARIDAALVTRHAIMAGSSWVVFAMLMWARLVLGLKGRRAAIMTWASFGLALFVVLLSALRLTD